MCTHVLNLSSAPAIKNYNNIDFNHARLLSGFFWCFPLQDKYDLVKLPNVYMHGQGIWKTEMHTHYLYHTLELLFIMP